MTEGKEVYSQRGVVAANPEEAARVGARILEAGGNAMDAASAASMACCMLAPMSTGVGGYICSVVVLEGGSGKIWSVDANAIAPAAAHETMYEVLPRNEEGGPINEGEYQCSVRGNANVYGPLAVGPPGMMAGMGIVWERWGKLKWEEIVAPSLKLLEDGFPYDAIAVHIRNGEAVIRKFPATEAHLMPEGKLPDREDIWQRPDMDGTLERIASAGWRDFYEGEIGRKIADHIQETGGTMTREDMAAYEPRVTDPYAVQYGGADIYGPILPNGCMSSLQILHMLDCLDLPDEDTPEYWHLYAEVLKLAWRDRLRYLADPGFADVPVQRLLSREYASGRVETIRQFPTHVDKLGPADSEGGAHGTLHVSTADVDGNVVSMTISQGGGFGSYVTVPGTGIILGHGMCRLDPRPGRANSVAPRKRPLNNTASMIARLPDRDIAIGLPGGRRIISVMPRAAQIAVDQGLAGFQISTAARMHVQDAEPVELTESAGEGALGALRSMGHDMKPVKAIAGAMNCAEFLKGDGRTRGGGAVLAAGAE